MLLFLIKSQPGVAYKNVVYKKVCNVIFQSSKNEEMTLSHEFTFVFIGWWLEKRKKHKRMGDGHIGGLSIKRGVQMFCTQGFFKPLRVAVIKHFNCIILNMNVSAAWSIQRSTKTVVSPDNYRASFLLLNHRISGTLYHCFIFACFVGSKPLGASSAGFWLVETYFYWSVSVTVYQLDTISFKSLNIWASFLM